MTISALRSIKPDDKPTPAQMKQAWLSLSAEIRATEQRAFQLRARRALLKADIMAGMRKWGMSDELITAMLERGNG